ncbi:MAG: hypothetical protein ACLP0L_18680 [Solirubrobacteraceae bacterium]
MDILATASLRARSSQAGWRSRSIPPRPLHLIPPEDRQRSASSPYASTASTTGAPGKPARDLWLLGKILDGGGDAIHGELMSYLFFAGEFAEKLIGLGHAHAQRWIDEHPADPWQFDPPLE